MVVLSGNVVTSKRQGTGREGASCLAFQWFVLCELSNDFFAFALVSLDFELDWEFHCPVNTAKVILS